MKALIIAAIFSLLSSFAHAAEPVVRVNALPSGGQLELYEESEGLFTILLMEYYTQAVALEHQLKTLGQDVVKETPAPSFEELEDLDIKVIKKYYSLAKKLYKQVLDTPELDALKFKYMLIDTIKSYENKCWNIRNDCFEEKMILSNQRDSACYERLLTMEKEYRARPDEQYAVMSFAVSGNIFVSSGSSKIENDPFVGIRLNVNGYKILGFGKGLDFWYEYLEPKLKTISKYESSSERFQLAERWTSYVSALGVGARFGSVVNSENFSDGISLDAGYFWCKGKIYNKETGDFDWSGLKIGLAYHAGPFHRDIPLGIFFGASIYHSFDKDLVFNTGNAFDDFINAGRSNMGLYIGIKYDFWRATY